MLRPGSLIGLLLLVCTAARAQTSPHYTAYFIGDTADVRATPRGGVCLMGGATEHDSASAWFVRRAGGGDVVVLRASGADGYNAYFYNQLPGARPNSVLSIVCNDRQAAFDPWVVRQVRGAEAIWLAGGDQSLYLDYFQNTPLHAALTHLLDSTQAVFGGTSAGCAVLGNTYYTGALGSATSGQAMADPFSSLITLGANDFLRVPGLERILTDTHFDARARQGRLATFLARFYGPGAPATPAAPLLKGIGVEEYTAVCVDTSGLARVFGDGSTGANPDVAWFVAPTCDPGQGPETLQAGQPLTWDRAGTALRVCRVLGTPTGRNTFDLRTFAVTTGGTWEYWSVANGALTMGAPAPAYAPCVALGLAPIVGPEAPAPAAVRLEGHTLVNSGLGSVSVQLTTLIGTLAWRGQLAPGERRPLPGVAAGVYVLRVGQERGRRVLVVAE